MRGPLEILIRPYLPADFDDVLSVINDAAAAYRGVIPPDRWHQPYMPREELKSEIAQQVEFWLAEDETAIAGVMGIQVLGELALIRHTYVAPSRQHRGIGRALLAHIRSTCTKPLLVGTWAAANWAIAFYERHGFVPVSNEDKERLLREYWNIPERQIETSVVLADRRWMDRNQTV